MTSMPSRIDYFDDPSAPSANSLVPSANAVVADSEGRILMIRRSDNGNWAVPGGAMDLGESIVQTAVRETLEETGIHCRVTGLVGIYTDPRHLIHYTSNDEVRQEFSIVFAAEYVDGKPTPSDESREVVWVPRDEVQDLKMDRSMRRRIEAYLHGEGLPQLG